MLWRDPNQRHRLVEIRDNLLARIAGAEREGWLGEVEGLKVSLTSAEGKLASVEQAASRSCSTNHSDMPDVTNIVAPASRLRPR